MARPIITDYINQNFFVESLGGAETEFSYLDEFPDLLYDKSLDSHWVRFLYALLGPAGTGYLRQQYLLARLKIEESGVSGADLDALYTSPFAFARIAEETYQLDASALLLPAAERAQIWAADASFRNRAMLYLKSIRAGGTVQGLRLAAQSGLNQPVEVIENYRALYDQQCDIPLGLPYLGTSEGLNEIIIIPRTDVPTAGYQSFVLMGEPVSGYFTLTVPIANPYQIIQPCLTGTSGSILRVPNSSLFAPGASLTLASDISLAGATYARVGGIVDSTHIGCVDLNGNPISLPPSATLIAIVGNAQTYPIPFDATASMIQSAIADLPCVGSGNVIVTGGPLPDQPINIAFADALAQLKIGLIQVNVDTDPATGVGSFYPAMINHDHIPDIQAFQSTSIVGVEGDSRATQFAPADVHNMLTAIDILRPVTSFVTTNIGQSVTLRQPAASTLADNIYTEVILYVTGSYQVPWPPLDGVNWVESGVEHESPHPLNTLTSQYVNYHDVSNVIAYDERALDDSSYANPGASTLQQALAAYYDTKIGTFSPAQQVLFPFLGTYTDVNQQWSAQFAASAQPDRPLVTGTVGDPIGIINDAYPVSYLGLPSVQLASGNTSGNFWASRERETGTDYLEIDLGTTQAVNFVSFDAVGAPFEIDIAYDLLDRSPQRSFIPARVTSSLVSPSITSLHYDSTRSSPWTTITLPITNALGQMIYTRSVRIGFTRNATAPPFQLTPTITLPYSIEVRNLRVGRNVIGNGSLGSTANGFSIRSAPNAILMLQPVIILQPS